VTQALEFIHKLKLFPAVKKTRDIVLDLSTREQPHKWFYWYYKWDPICNSISL